MSVCYKIFTTFYLLELNKKWKYKFIFNNFTGDNFQSYFTMFHRIFLVKS